MSDHVWFAILSSSLLSGFLGAFVTGLYNLRAKKSEYVNDYNRMVLNRRLTAYEQLENLISSLKTAVLDKTGRPYHLLFSRDDDWETAYKLLFGVMSQALWLSDEVFVKTRDLSYLLFRGESKRDGAVEFGKEHYQEIAELRSQIEKIHAADMLTLHDVKGFLKRKKEPKTEGFMAVRFQP